MLGMIGFTLFLVSLLLGYTTARQFVRARLRYVDAIRGMGMPVIAAIAAAAVAMPVFWLLPLPFFTAGTAAVFGLSVGVGVRAGAKDVTNRTGYIEGP